MRIVVLVALCLSIHNNALAQGCCSGGGSNPIAGGGATGVLQQYEMETSVNYQSNSSARFFKGNKEVEQEGIYDELSSDYFFLRTDYGVSKKLTLSLATGYYTNKTLHEKGKDEALSSKGMGDLIVFPRFSVYNKQKGNNRVEVALGIGAKLPLGSQIGSGNQFTVGVNYRFLTKDCSTEE